jgi:hypothetical protein
MTREMWAPNASDGAKVSYLQEVSERTVELVAWRQQTDQALADVAQMASKITAMENNQIALVELASSPETGTSMQLFRSVTLMPNIPSPLNFSMISIAAFSAAQAILIKYSTSTLGITSKLVPGSNGS